MPSLRSQQKLDFPVRKESVRRKTKTSRLAAENEDPIAEVIPPRKRGTQFDCPISLEGSPSKRTRNSVTADVSSPKTRRSSKRSQKTITPTKKSLEVEASPKVLLCPLSPSNRQNQQIPRISLDSPLKENTPTPQKSHRQTADPNRLFSSVRALDFSLSRPILRTPKKSEVVPNLTPTKRALTFSPGKEMRLALSPPPGHKGYNWSPRKQIGFPLASPKKFGDVTLSPRKLGSIPMSPRKLGGVPMSPRKLDVRSLNSPLRLAKQEGICYQRAKQALHTALPDRIVCRDKEYKVIESFLAKHTKPNMPGSLYVSGAPGTGKTAVLSHIICELQERDDCQTVYINCMSFKNSQGIFNKVLYEMDGKESVYTMKKAVKKLEKLMCSKGKPVVLILDEIDQLDSKNQEVLYIMFEWPTLQNSRLALIGIANALDLTDRILPRLQARSNCRPQLLNFEPYSKDQIVSVLKDRLSQVELEGHIVLEPSAVQFCARKVAAVAGDMRRALDVCRRAVEMVEADVRKQHIIQPAMGLAGVQSPSKRPPVPKKITVAHIMKTLNEVYGSRVSSSSGQQQTIPLQQKLAICTLLLMLKGGKGKEVTLGKLHEAYQKVCLKQQVTGIGQSEFYSLCTLVEAKGIMALKKAKETRMTKVTLKMDETELQQALQDKVLMSTILANGLPK